MYALKTIKHAMTLAAKNPPKEPKTVDLGQKQASEINFMIKKIVILCP